MKRRELFHLLALSGMATTLPGGLVGCARSVTVGGFAAPTVGSRIRVLGDGSRTLELVPMEGIAAVFDDGVETARLDLGEHAFPLSGALARDGRIAVVEASSRTVLVFDARLEPIATLRGPELDAPNDVAFDARGSLFVSDASAHRVVRFAPDLSPAASLGSAGSNPGELNGPRSVAIDASHRCHVVDVGNARVQVFDARGALASHYGTYGRGEGQFLAPRSICIDGLGRTHVADPVRGDVQVFDDGTLVDTFVPARGRPIAVAATPDGGVYVTLA